MLTILIVVLGCNISFILNDRIYTAIKFVENLQNTNIHWFLSGGIKYDLGETISEAEKMAIQISKHNRNLTYKINNNWQYIYDTKSTNTVENFIMLQYYLNKINNTNNFMYDKLYVVTSKFHYNRAHKITNEILNEQLNWILSDLELNDSVYWEKIHIKNVNNDINKATEFKKSINFELYFDFI